MCHFDIEKILFRIFAALDGERSCWYVFGEIETFVMLIWVNIKKNKFYLTELIYLKKDIEFIFGIKMALALKGSFIKYVI